MPRMMADALTRRTFLLRASVAGAAVWQLGCGGSSRSSSQPSSLISSVQAYAQGLVGSGSAIGVAAAAYDKERTMAAGYGHLSQSGAAADERTLFELGSVTKVFTATVLGDAVASGSLSLDMPIDSLLPAGTHLRPGVAGRITLQMLGTHTSGLPRSQPNEHRARNGNVVGYTVADLVAFLNSFQPRYPPGTHYEYSNIGFGLLGLVLGKAAGSDWPTLVARQITGPLGMADTVVSPSGGQVARTATGYNGSRAVAPLVTPSFLGGGGALKSTAADMLTFLRAQIEPSRAPAPLARGIPVTQRGYFPLPGGSRQGLAWSLTPLTGGGDGLSKDGATHGFSSFVAYDPTQQQGAFLVANHRSLNPAIDPGLQRLLGFRAAPVDVSDSGS